MAEESRLIISIDARNAERNARELSRELQNITNSGNSADRQVNALGSSLRSLAGYMAGIVTVGAAINKVDVYIGLQNRLKLVTNSQVELNTATTDTFNIAQKTASAWESVATVYQRFADNAERLNITMAQTAALTETVSKAISISGGSAASAEAALVQFGQALASGVLRGEEFNSIAEQAPGLLKAIAFGLDTNVGSLRAMAAEGQITGDVLVKSLSKAQPYIDDLFNKTDFTISQSFTKLTNEITKFVGEAGTGSGAAKALSGAIDSLASNLSTIADIAVVGGVTLLTKAILSQAVAIQGSVAASIQRRAADLALLQSQVQLAAIEVQRTRQIAAQAISEIGLARQELNSATTRQARAAATLRLTQAEIAHRIALNQTTAAIAANTAAQNTLNASQAIGSRLLGLVGGPIGAITIGVAALAAGYMYLKSRTAEATEKLAEQAKVAEKTNEELTKLSGNDKKNAVADLTAAFYAQNNELQRSKESVDAVLFAIRASSVENEKARKVTEDARNGVISYNKAIELLNKMDIPTDLYDMLKKQALQYDENSAKAINSQRALGILGSEFKLSGSAAQNQAVQIGLSTDALNENAGAAAAASKALQEYRNKAQSQAANDIYTTGLINQGRSPAQAKAILDLQNAKGMSAILTKEEIDQALINLELTEKNAAAEKRYSDAISNRAKAQADAARKAKQAAEEARRKAEQLAKEQYDLRESISYGFANRTIQIEKDLQNKIADIQKANFNPKDTAGFIANAKARADSEKEIFVAQLEYELNEFQLTEEAKLKKRYEINKLLIESNLSLSNENRDIALQLAEKQYKQEAAYLELSKRQREFQAREQFIDETTRINERYILEQAEIFKINDVKERAFMLEMSRLRKQEEQTKRLQDAQNNWARTQAQMNGTSGYLAISDTQNEQTTQSQSLFDAQMVGIDPNAGIQEIAAQREAIWQASQDRITAIEEAANKARLDLNLSNGEQIAGSMASMFKTMLGEQSGAYKAMFAIEKGMAIARSVMAIQTGIAQASSLPFPANLGAMATVAAQTASIIANIKAVSDVGFQSGGYTGSGGVSDVAGVVHGQEYVLNAAATKRVGVGTLDAINSGASMGGEISVNIQNYGTSKQFDVQQIDANTVRIIARDEAEKVVTGQLSSPNSPISKGIKNNFNTSNRRG